MKNLLIIFVLLLGQIGLIAQGSLHTYYNINASAFRTYADRTPDDGFILAGNVGIATNNDVFVQKTDVFGNVQWTRQISTPLSENVVDVTYNANDSSIYVLYFQGNAIGFLLKLDIFGQVVWNRPLNIGMPISEGSVCSALEITSDNNILISSFLIDGTNTYHLGLAKLSSEADSMWVRFYSVPNNSTFSMDVIEAADGSYILAGGIDTSYSGGNGNGRNGLLINTDTAGNVNWQRIYNFSISHYIKNAVQTSDGGFLLLGYDNGGANSKFMVIKTDANGNLLWTWSRPGGNAYNIAHDAVENMDGSYTITGFGDSNTPPYNNTVAIIKLSSLGTEMLSSYEVSGQAVAQGKRIWHLPNSGYAIFGVDGQGPFIMSVDSMGQLFSNQIYGRVFHDLNNNCIFDNGEPALSNAIIDIQSTNGAHNFFTATNNGSYLMEVDSGTHVVSARQISPYWSFCQNPQTVSFSGFYNRDTVDFPISVIDSCTYMTVDISAPLIRRCFPSIYFVNYSNLGTIAAQNVYVDVTLDPYLTFDSSSATLISQSGNTYRFAIGTVNSLANGYFRIHVTVGCDPDVALGQVHCSEAHIYPDTICIPNYWNGAIIEASSTCANDTVTFILENRGSAMSGPRSYAIIEEHVMIRINPFQLGGGQSQDISIAAVPGAAYRIIAEQEDGFPNLLGDSVSTSSVVGCNTPPVVLNPSVPLQFYNGNMSPFISTDCQPNRGAYDPNDKTGQPLGYGASHFIENHIPLNYHIRFQNTGTDTAFRVLIVDTLSPYLNPSSIRMGASSHAYTWELRPGNVLAVYFNNIMLPDSNVNEPLSHGFFKFEIEQTAGNADGIVINNTAHIYFDFNAAIVTNTTFHTIGRDFITVQITGTDNVLEENISVNVYPNPFENSAILSVSGGDFENLELEIIDLSGRVLRRQFSNGSNQIQIDRGNLLQGLYFYRLSADGKLLNTGKMVIR